MVYTRCNNILEYRGYWYYNISQSHLVIYTLGHGKSYRHRIETYGADFRKVGRNEVHKYEHIPDNYPGGYAFLTEADALKRIEETIAEDGHNHGLEVFGLIADWDKDTVKSEHGWWHALLNDSQIVSIGG